MYKKTKPTNTTLKVRKAYQGESIEHKINRIINNKEPIKDGAPLIYTERKNGVEPAYDIRTDRFEIAIDAMNLVTKSHTAKRQHRLDEAKKLADEAKKNQLIEEKTETKKDGGADSTQPTDTK